MANSNTYTDEYRRECADYAISSGRPATQIARELKAEREDVRPVGGGQAAGAVRPAGPGRPAGGPRAQAAQPGAGDGERVPKKSRGLLREGTADGKYRLMGAERADYPVKMMARLPKVSRSGSCRWLGRRDGGDPRAGLRAGAGEVWLASGRVFGARRVHAMLAGDPGSGSATPCAVRACMRELGICGIQPRSSRRTTVPGP